MDLIETVGARMVLLGASEYRRSLSDLQRGHADLTASVQAGRGPTQELTDATIRAQAAERDHAAAMRGAVAAEREYQAASRGVAEANAALAESDTVATRTAKEEADARLAAAAASREATATQARAAAESSAAAKTSAAEVETAERRKAAAAEMGAGALRTAAWGVTAVTAVVAGVSVKMAGDFEQSTTRLVTSAGETQQNLDMVRQGILGMAGAVGYSSDELSKAMYKIESGGHHGADGLDVLKAAAQGAKTENADLTVVADAVTSALQDYHLKGSDAADVTSKLVAATASGKTTFEELSRSMSAILPIASANHVSLSDILGDLSSMTVHGMSAQQASQNLADAIRHMAAPTQVQQKELALLGINAQQLSNDLGSKGLSGTIMEITDAIKTHMGPEAGKVILDMQTALRGLPPTVQDLGAKLMTGSISMKEYSGEAKKLDPIAAGQAMQFATLAKATHGIGNSQKDGATVMQSYSKALRDSMGDATGLNVALMLTGENTDITTGSIRSITDANREADGSVRGWADIQGTFNTKLDQAKGGLGALAIQIGTVLLPPLTTVLGWIATGATWLSQHRDAATALAIVMGGILVLGIVAAGMALWGLVAPLFAVSVAAFGIELPFLVVAAIVLLVVGIIAFAAYEIISHWSGISAFFSVVWANIQVGASAIGQVFVGIGHFFQTAAGIIADVAVWLWQNILSPVFSAIGFGVRLLMTIIITVFVTPYVLAFRLLAAIATWLWENALGPMFRKIGAGVMWLWQNAVMPAWRGITGTIGAAYNGLQTNVFTPLMNGVRTIGQFFLFLWTQYVEPAWRNIREGIAIAWFYIQANVFLPIQARIAQLGAIFLLLYYQYVLPAWRAIQDAASTAYNYVDQHVFQPFRTALSMLGVAFDVAVAAIGAAWGKIRDTLAVPIHWVVDHVYTQGIKAVWDHVADFTGIGHLPDAPAFATGGVLDGYAPGQDSVMAWLSPGEGVLIPEAVRLLTPEFVHAINAEASGRSSGLRGPASTAAGSRYAAGGLVPAFADGGTTPPGGGGFWSSVGSGISSAWNATVSFGGRVLGSIQDFMTDPVGKAKDWLQQVISGSAADGPLQSTFGKVGLGVPAHAIDGLVAKVKKWWDDTMASGGGAGGSVQAYTPQILQALGMLGQPPSLLGAVQHRMQQESGGNPTIVNRWDSNWLAGHPSVGLMQVIAGTFAANAGPFRGLGPFMYGVSTNPLANIYAGLHYAIGRYPSLQYAMMKPGGYAAGGILPAFAGGGVLDAYAGGRGIALAGARADGGPVEAGRPYLVGERGPEVFVPDRPGTVVPPPPGGPGGRGGDGAAVSVPGGTTIIVESGAVTINESPDGRKSYDSVMQALADRAART